MREARNLVKSDGILALPDPKRGKNISWEVKEAVLNFMKMMSFLGLCREQKILSQLGRKLMFKTSTTL